MEATIQYNQMDVDREEARPGPDLASIPQERHVWRIPELPSIPQDERVELTPNLEKEGPLASTTSKKSPEVSKEKPKGPHKKQRGPKNNLGKRKGKTNWHRPYPQGYRIPKLEPSAMDRTLIKLTAKKQERMKRTFPHK
ncbi:hypothetical protein O181_081381 [Austropuccinia psidii MF-1]|uniref:Uncharacterized protein n=1 Tax=Austropuccinia psidii MF-1 TaxID=1389203 RepID=A0A9Q3FK40_9BASI|nr:hypothetical protein [Austropuccinia psidii MF-1]